MSDSNSSSDHAPISVWRALYEEHAALRGPVPIVEEYLRQYEQIVHEGGSEVAVASAEQRLKTALHQQLHSAQRSALCFSGGGIRSAIFNLGVLQGLAKWSDQTEKGPLLLGEFDYLSTVSGGGYVGAWFSAWARRDTDGAAGVIRKLAERQESLFDPEPKPLRHLRTYSSYLSPRMGLFSGDSLALAATVLRNVFLNWLVIIPIVAAVLLLPELTYRLAYLCPRDVSSSVQWALLIAAFVAGAAGTAYVGWDLPSAGHARKRYVWYVSCCLAPLIVAATALNTFWAWLPAGHANAAWWDVVGLGKHYVKWWHFTAFGGAMHGGGMIFGIWLARYHYNRPPTRKGLIASAAAVITGTVAGIAGFGLSTLPQVQPDGSLVDPRLYTCSAFPVVMILFMLAATLLVGGTSYITEDEDREWWARAGGWLLLVSITWPVFSALVLYAGATINWLDLRLTTSLAGGAGLTGWVTSSLSASSRTSAGRREDGSNDDTKPGGFNLGDALSKLFFPIFLALLVILLAACNTGLMGWMGAMVDPLSLWPVLWLWAVYACICTPAAYFINVNKFSLHGMYRQRLIRAFLGASNDKRDPHPFTGFDENDNIAMAELSSQKPLHVVNMALNLVSGENLAWQQRKAASFTSTRLHTGSCRVGYQPSREYGGRFRHGKTPISLGTAITISGAAASPNMGYNSSTLLAFVMMLFNARLGCWLGNPKKEATVWKRPGPRWGIRPFIDEALGLTTDSNNWVYLSDGGHFDNLGLYEMVLRRCHTIVVADASADPGFTYEDLGNAVRKIRVDLGVPIELDTEFMPTSLPRSDEGRKRLHFATARILYSAVDDPLADGKPPADGVLIYVKPCLTGDEPPDVRQYASTDPRFPHQPTSDQFFDEAQFESYRRLGLHSIDAICGEGWPFDQEPSTKLSLNEFVARAAGHVRGPAARPATV